MNNFVIITAPSAAGKTTLIKRYVEQHADKVYFSVSHTTRAIRNDEINGTDYYFINREEFQKKIDNRDFIEWACVHNNFYGTSFSEMEKAKSSNKIFILDIDVQGALNLMKQGIKAKYIFIMPPSIDELRKRLISRGSDNNESIERRVNNAKEEIDSASQFDYVILNDNLDKAYKELCDVIDRK